VQLHQHALDLLWVPEEPLAAPATRHTHEAKH